MMFDNLEIIFKYDEEGLPNIKKYCYERDEEKYEPLDYNTLVYFFEEALGELVNCGCLYDLRNLKYR